MSTAERSPVRAVAIPTEHGGWSLTLEPVLLGLIVAPGVAGVALGVAALGAFLARTPLKLALGDRRRERRLGRTVLAERVAVAYLVVVAVAVAVAWWLAAASFWLPLVVAAPLVVVQLWFDVRSRSRRLIPELAGTIGVGSVAAAIVLAGGGETTDALGAWAVAAARAVAAIPFVRSQLARFKGTGEGRAASDLGQLAALAVVAGAWLAGLVPAAALVVVAVLAAVHVWLVRRPPPRAALIGAQQVVLGLTVVLVAGLALAAP